MKYLSYPILIILLALAVLQFIPILGLAYSNWSAYLWMLYGVAAYIVARVFLFRKNEKWMQTFAHELSHTIVGMMFFRKIHSFYAEEGSGVIAHSGRRHFGDIFISLAPYCLPYFTYAFMLLKLVGASNMYYIFDLIIGLTLAFHFGCFISQTGSYQTDIQKHGYVRSYLYIAVFLIFNLSVILLSITQGLVGSVAYIGTQYWADILLAWAKVSQWVTSLM